MRITEIMSRKSPMFSLEFFPPRTDDELAQLFLTLNEVRSLDPGFVSVTYGAGGGTRDRTVEIVKRAKTEIGLESAAHLTCLGHSKEEIGSLLDNLVSSNIENVVALRGDPPKGQTRFVPNPNGFSHADELTRYIRTSYPVCIAVAGYPEGHVESPDRETDWAFLCQKVKAGADLVITQLFFDNRLFFAFEKRMREMGVVVPIIPGIMPITNYAQILRFTRICGATIPADLVAKLEPIQEDSDAVQRVGVDHAVQQCRDLISHGVPGIHFYTLNKSTASREIIEALRE